jgi:hypothetical protein
VIEKRSEKLHWKDQLLQKYRGYEPIITTAKDTTKDGLRTEADFDRDVLSFYEGKSDGDELNQDF